MGAELVEFAPAKINLTLRVLGRRADGYHELQSLVAFARDVGDVVRFTPGAPLSVTITAPQIIDGVNLADRALRLVAEAQPDFPMGAISLEKNLPVAGGVGGGSADAAAVLRLLKRAAPDRAESIDWLGIARRLGADVPVCFGGEAAVIAGTGERIWPVHFPSVIHAVLVNPNTPTQTDKTARVFRALAAETISGACDDVISPVFETAADVLAYLEAGENSLQAAAASIAPEINYVLAILEAAPRCRVARLSGAGPTCFGVFDTAEFATEAARTIKAQRPAWWVRCAKLS